MVNAIAREKTIKGWLRRRKVALIEGQNPTWADLSESWYGPVKLLTPHTAQCCQGKQVLRVAQDDKFVANDKLIVVDQTIANENFIPCKNFAADDRVIGDEQTTANESCAPNGRTAIGNNTLMEYKTLDLSITAGVAVITLNRPDKRNAISFQLVDELLDSLDKIETASAHAVILTGSGKAFCAGMDLDELKSLLGKTHDENVKDSTRIAGLFRRLYEFPLPTIAAVNGAAIAGGTGLATMCDFTLAVPEAKFGYTEVRIGFVPAIVSSILVWQVGHKVARDLLMTGRLFDATEAHRYGLVNEVVDSGRLMPRARELASQLSENSPSSVRATKRLINSFISRQLDEQIAAAIEDNARIRTTADFREGISSFLEKRKPRWSGQ